MEFSISYSFTYFLNDSNTVTNNSGYFGLQHCHQIIHLPAVVDGLFFCRPSFICYLNYKNTFTLLLLSLSTVFKLSNVNMFHMHLCPSVRLYSRSCSQNTFVDICLVSGISRNRNSSSSVATARLP